MQIELGYDAHDRAVAAAGNSAAELAAARHDAERMVGRMLDGGWSGAAAEAFGEAWSEWVAGATDVVAALDEIREGLVLARLELRAADVDSGSTLDLLATRLAP